jgi:thymidine phosphorylase
VGIDTRHEAVVYLPRDAAVSRAEGFEALSRVEVSRDGTSIVATLNVIEPAFGVIAADEAGLSESAWRRLGAADGDVITLSHPEPIGSLTHLRWKMSGGRLGPHAMAEVIGDVVRGRYAEMHLSAFVAACAGGGLDFDEVVSLTRAMVDRGARLSWGAARVVDKHCIGGLLGNRTTPIVVAIAAAHGLTIPKTSSRAITSPAGTADMMETLAPVTLDVDQIRRVVEAEGGCVVWGGSVELSPADDILIRVERALDVDSPGQLVASVLSKKVAAGSTHVVIDIPWGRRAKISSLEEAERLGRFFQGVGRMVGLEVRIVVSDGAAPVGRGFGPALEAYDVLSVLQGRPDAPVDLRERALRLAGEVLEWAPGVAEGAGLHLARSILDDGRAWAKFQRICAAQGGMREPPRARLTVPVLATRAGRVAEIDNRRLGRIAKFAGAPTNPAAGLVLHVRRGEVVTPGQPLFTVHAGSKGELDYALGYAGHEADVVRLAPDGEPCEDPPDEPPGGARGRRPGRV